MISAISAYPNLLMAAVFAVFAISMLLIVISVLSAKSLGGRLGAGLKKIAAGSIMHACMFFLMMLFQYGWETILTPVQLQVFFVTVSLIGSGLLIAGFTQIYLLSKELKLFY